MTLTIVYEMEKNKWKQNKGLIEKKKKTSTNDLINKICEYCIKIDI